MRLYSITTALLLCLSALPPLCASLETEIADAITHHRRMPLNESNSSTTDMEARALFSRTNGKANTASHPTFGPVQTAWEHRGHYIGSGRFGSVYVVNGGFPVPIDDGHGGGGHKLVPAVIKEVRTLEPLDRKWVALELVYLKSVGELLGHGERKDKKYHYIVMPYMGMKWSEAVEEGFPVQKKELAEEIAEELANDYEKKYEIRHLDVGVRNMVFEKVTPGAEQSTPRGKELIDPGFALRLRSPPTHEKQSSLLKQYPTLKDWKGHLVDWGYAQFRSQEKLPKFQIFPHKCRVDGGAEGV